MKARNAWLVAAAFLSTVPSTFAQNTTGETASLPPVTTFLSQLPAGPSLAVSTVPPNGDVNPYGVAFAPSNFVTGGILHPNDALVTNFNNGASNLQGTGRTIVRITPQGQQSLFWEAASSVGLSTALGILSKGYTVAGSVPTTDGTCKTMGAGNLWVIDKNGHLVQTFSALSHHMNGPWDLTIHDLGSTAQIFVSSARNGTITRLDVTVGTSGLVINHEYVIAEGYTFYCNPTALIIGPTGLAYDATKDILYVASTGNNAVYAISNAGTTTTTVHRGTAIFSSKLHLHGPLGLVLVPNGDLVMSEGDVVNPDPRHVSELTEIRAVGTLWQFVMQYQIDPNAGAAFGIALDSAAKRFAAVDDANNMLYIYNLK